MLDINPITPEYPKIKKVVDILTHDGVIVYPTDTIYGFGCDIFSKKALERIYQIKNKKATGFSFVIPTLESIAEYAYVSDYAYKIIKRLLPGPYTFVFKATKKVPRDLIPNKKTVAIRMPDSAISQAIVTQLGHPIVSTSVNVTGEPHYSEPELIESAFGDQVDIVINGGVLENNPSSVIDLSGDQAIIIRRGLGDVSMFEQ